MPFPAFDHAAFLNRVWLEAPPKHNIGGSSFYGGTWQSRGLPDWTNDFDPAVVNLAAPADLRAALAKHVGQPEAHVMATVGTSGANLAATLWACRPGCNVVVERPIYSPLEATAEGVGATVRRVDRRADEGWRLHPDDVNEAVDKDTQLIVLASPNNPTQAAASRHDLLAIAQIAEDADAHVLVDQVYQQLTDDPFAGGVHPRIIATAGFNKSWGLPSMRVGWLVAEPEIVAEIHNVHMQTLMAPSSQQETMAARLLPLAGQVRRQLEMSLEKNHAVYRAWLDENPAVMDPAPRHLTAFPKLPVDDTAEFCERIAKNPGVAMVPGEYFGRAGYARIGLGGDPDKLAAGLQELTQLIS